ncbi:DUF1996 domain-containing protein [Roseateles oligotrophus]|uniref:DUF1996 domain-containing protein n=1 Tax=Roseateles oligotrophus TaxID=1769250 RepID=A0ABT2Y9K9_9BURK|nr:DUF1996 domain-containing protein [Roseateles oligotrophus]MCV2366996.1 DUF1996 domain-containing protein [Roseateles oligotrophus]
MNVRLVPPLLSLVSVLTACGGGGIAAPEPVSSPPVASVNTAPSITALANASVQEGMPLSTSFTVADKETALAQLKVSATSSNPALLDSNTIALSGSGANLTLKLTPRAGATGTSTITITIVDDQGASANTSFVLTVQAAPSAAPSVKIASGPEAPTTDPYARFEFSATNATGYECALDDGAFAACASPMQLPHLNAAGLYERLAIGNRQFKVRARNAAGQTGAVATWSWTVTSILAANSPDFAAQRLIDKQVFPVAAGKDGWKGIFRINCEFDHAAYDDPIVFPGMNGHAHLHMFYGAKNVDADTTFDSLFRSPEAGCSGGVLNRSSYWLPALLAPTYGSDGTQAKDAAGELLWQVVPAKVGEGERSAAAAHEVIYYSAAVSDLNSIEAPPIGLRIVAGSAATSPSSLAQSHAVARWHCLSWGSTDAKGGPWSSTIPECYADVNTPEMIRLDLFFPSCWNGVDLDSKNHQDHMAYPITQGGKQVCPATHPKPVARVSYHYAFPIFASMLDPKTRTAKNFRLASDNYTVGNSNGGLSLHGDWFNAWHPEALDLVVKGCIKGARDCHDGNFALQSSDGSWTGSVSLGTLLNAKGSGVIPAVIKGGMGNGHGH